MTAKLTILLAGEVWPLERERLLAKLKAGLRKERVTFKVLEERTVLKGLPQVGIRGAEIDCVLTAMAAINLRRKLQRVLANTLDPDSYQVISNAKEGASNL